MNWRETISKTAQYLEAHKVPDSYVAAESLAARLLKTSRANLVMSLDAETPPRYLEALRRAMSRLKSGEPLQYVLGEWDFRRLTLKCDKRALIPRPETEGLVSHVLSALDKLDSSIRPLIIDAGTGTGAIALSIASEAKRPVSIIALDISSEAIELAKENAALLNLADKVHFVVTDGLDSFDEPESIDIIVSNPPYVTSAECAVLDPRVRDFEPRLALDGGVEGLDFYERYLADALNLLKPNGQIFFEIGESQGAKVLNLMQSFGFLDARIEKDLAGLDRYAIARLP